VRVTAFSTPRSPRKEGKIVLYVDKRVVMRIFAIFIGFCIHLVEPNNFFGSQTENFGIFHARLRDTATIHNGHKQQLKVNMKTCP
jgi:hypothetical protein